MAAGEPAGRQMRPDRFVERLPVAAMNEDDEALRRAFRQEGSSLLRSALP
jgi:hypothetical protein